jgi:hypothetical protein
VLEGRCQKPNPIARRSALRPSFYDSTFYRPISDRNNSQPLLVVVEPVIVSVRRVRRHLFKRWISRILEVFCFDRWGYLSAAVFRKIQVYCVD